MSSTNLFELYKWDVVKISWKSWDEISSSYNWQIVLVYPSNRDGQNIPEENSLVKPAILDSKLMIERYIRFRDSCVHTLGQEEQVFDGSETSAGEQPSFPCQDPERLQTTALTWNTARALSMFESKCLCQAALPIPSILCYWVLSNKVHILTGVSEDELRKEKNEIMAALVHSEATQRHY